MAFPASPLQALVELQLAGTWTDVSALTYVRAGIKIKRGRSSEAAVVDPTTCTLTLDNRDGRFSARNPTGPYFGALGRNTPLRVSVLGLDDVSLQLSSTSSAVTTHASALNTASDLDVRVEVSPFNWYGNGNMIGKWDFAAGAASSWLFNVGAGGPGYLSLFWSTTGADFPSATSTVPVPRDSGQRFAVRALLDVDNGAGGRTVTFWYADSIAGPWLQLGDPVVQAGTTVVFLGTADMAVGQGSTLLAKYYSAQVRTGTLGATLVASPDFTAQTPGAGSFVDAQARTWTVTAPAVLSSANVRFVGEVSAWPAQWDPSGRDVHVPITAAGIMRRLLANTPPLRSVLRRSLPALTALRAYWPMEDATGATSLAYGLPDATGAYAMTIAAGVTPAGYSGFAASDPIATFPTGSYARGRVPTYTATTQAQVRFLGLLPATSPPADGTVIAKVTTSTAIWSLLYKTANALQVVAADVTTGVIVHTGVVTGFTVLDKPLRYSIELTASGGNTNYSVATLAPGATTGSVMTGTAAGVVPGRVTYVQVGAPGASSSVAIGHVTVESAVTTLFDLGVQLNGYTGELASARASRLAGEERYPIVLQGVSTTTPMGPQRSKALVDLLREAADADLGIFGEQRGTAALAYRPRQSMWGRRPVLALNYAAQHLSAFQPVEDDQLTVNDVIATRTGGSSYEASLAAGTLSTQAPPLGIGRYQAALTLSLAGDNQLRDQANYRLALGTLDEPRYPTISVELHRAPFLASRALTAAALALDLGDVLQVSNPPAFYAPLQTLQRVEGYTETLTPKTYRLDYNCSPGTVWANVGTYNDPVKQDRYDSGSSTLAAAATAGATTLTVATLDALWTTTPADWPFQILVAGEVMTVTAVAGSSSPQTFTVTRAVNGVSKAQALAAPVHVYPVSYYGF